MIKIWNYFLHTLIGIVAFMTPLIIFLCIFYGVVLLINKYSFVFLYVLLGFIGCIIFLRVFNKIGKSIIDTYKENKNE